MDKTHGSSIELKEAITKITRGAQLTTAELEDTLSKEPTDYQYLMLRDIQDGLVNDDLPYLKAVDSRHDKYCLEPEDLLISKVGLPFKVAVADDFQGKKVLATGNLFIIRLNRDIIKPWCLKAYFDSEDGIKALEGIASGTVMRHIGVSGISSLIIPCPSLEEQQRIENNYREALSKIKDLKRQLASAIEASKNIFEEVEL